MTDERLIERLLLLVLATSACVLPDQKLGEGAEESDDDATGTLESSDGTADASASASASATSSSTVSTTETTDGELPGVGAPCDHHTDIVVHSTLLTYPAVDCQGDVCLYAPIASAPHDACTADEECNAADPGRERFVCAEDQTCTLNPAYLAERSMCSGFCEDDSDCVTDEATNCETGFSCEPHSSLGEACCRPVCVCNDDLDRLRADELRLDCMNGEVTGCCDTLPGNGLCPD